MCRPIMQKYQSLPLRPCAVSRKGGCNERHNVRFVRIPSTTRPPAPTKSHRLIIN